MEPAIAAIITGGFLIFIGLFNVFRGRKIVCGILLVLCGFALLKWGASH